MGALRGTRTFVLLVASATTAIAQTTVPQDLRTFNGRVATAVGTPIAGAEILRLIGDSIASLSRTDDSGRFTIVFGSAPREMLRARRLGYASVDQRPPTTTAEPVMIVLEPVATYLESFDVFGDLAPGAWLSDFYRRRRENSFGRYFTQADITSANKRVLSEVLRQTSGVTLTPSQRFGYVVRVRGCRDAPMIWLDGMRLPGAELDEVAKPDDVAALEVYRSTAGVPAQYLDRSNRGCGTILIWTRHQ